MWLNGVRVMVLTVATFIALVPLRLHAQLLVRMLLTPLVLAIAFPLRALLLGALVAAALLAIKRRASVAA